MKSPIAALLLFFLISGAASAKLDVGTVPPDLLGKTPDKEEIRVSQYKGRVVLVTFWAAWCGYCLRELPQLDVLKGVAGDKIEIVAVNVKDSLPTYRHIRRQLKDTGLIFTHDARGTIASGYNVTSYPNLYVIDQNGVISAVHVGFGDDSMKSIIADINKLLRAPPAPLPAAAPAVAPVAAGAL
jgi:thiol-disulfide isomerase/thioredoxin